MAKGNIKVVLQGRGPLTLRDADYIATGGEGSIYRANSTVVKLYTDPTKMVRDGMDTKVQLLARLQHPGIVAPQGVVTDEKNKPIGFYMPWVSGEPLSRVFVTDFRTRTGFSDAHAVQLVGGMRDVVQYAHAQQATMVDANELNWLVGMPTAKKAPVPYVIDVDSWAVGKWGASVIMPSIRDWHAKAFGPPTDWFAWGITTFQVFTGLHPYKGKLNGYKPGELERRMKENASVFTPGVILPHATRDFTCIPGPLLDWYQATFQQGTRTQPPSPFDTTRPATAAQVLRTVITTVGAIVYEKRFGRTGDPVRRTWSSGAAWLASGALVDMETGLPIGHLTSPDAEVIRAGRGWLLADWPQGQGVGAPTFTYVENQVSTPLSVVCAARRFFRVGERLFTVTDRGLSELTFHNMGKPLITFGAEWGLNPNATRWFDEVAVADVLGATFLYLPLPQGGMHQVRVKELDGLTPLAAKAGNRFVVVMAVSRTGEYHKLELTFNASYTSYTLWQGKADTPNLNAALLPKGVTATIVDDGELTIFVPTSGKTNTVTDRGITTAMSLSNWENKVIYLKNGEVWQVRLT